MDVNEYLPMFLAEGREHLEELNITIVALEEHPEDRDRVDAIFRIAHSLKGMSATMGFANMAALTHEMEEVFELLRQRKGGLSRDAVDAVLACLDALEATVDSIEAGNGEGLDPEPLKVRLRGLVRSAGDGDQPEEAPAASPEPSLAAKADGRRVVHVRAAFAEGCSMPGIRAFMLLTALGETGELLASVPDQDAVEDFAGEAVEAWIVSDLPCDTVRDLATKVPEIGDTEVKEAEFEDPVAVPAADTAEDADTPSGPVQPAKKAATVRIAAERLDELMHLVGELVLHRTQIEAIAAHSQVPELTQATQQLTRTSHALQAMVMQVRMIPVDAVFMRFPRLVRDLSGKLGKQVELKLVGNDTELDRTVVESLGDPLVHLIRNSLDHGVEGPEERAAAGKPETGVIELAAGYMGGSVAITVSDDGRGINPEVVAHKAVERGLITEEQAATIDAEQAAELIFAPGFSTCDETSDISGRGVGMDAVRAAIRALGGEVFMTSEHGVGTRCQVRLPLTLAIVTALVIEAGGEPFAIPLDRIERAVLLKEQTVRHVGGDPMLVLEDGVLPLIRAERCIDTDADGDLTEHAVIVHGGRGRFAVMVSALVGQNELVTRALPPELADRGALSGGALLADGRIALIMDCDAFAEQALVQNLTTTTT